MKILLVGGHQKVVYLIKSLLAKRHEVSIVNEDEKWCNMISRTYEITCVTGDGTKPEILKFANTANMDVVIALENQDASNLVICQIAINQFHVKKTFSILNDPKNIQIFESLGVSKCFSCNKLLADMIDEETLMENLDSYLPLKNGKILVSELELSDRTEIANKKLWEIGLPNDSTVVCILRDEDTIIPQGNVELKKGDKVIMLSTQDAYQKLVPLFNGSIEE